MFSIGLDIGTSFVKASLFDCNKGITIALESSPENELSIISINNGWAEQEPEIWWEHAKTSIIKLRQKNPVQFSEVRAIGISYQMHGLVCIDENQEVLRPSIIWCDDRSVEIGDAALAGLGESYCKENLLNSPGNFTASKLAWVKENEGDIFEKIYKILLPGDFIAMKFTGEVFTTNNGLSEGIFWDYFNKSLSYPLMQYYGFSDSIIPKIVETFSDQGHVLKSVSDELGLPDNVTISYRCGDQPNNAFSLNVLNPGESAATAGTSGVIYYVSDVPSTDSLSRVNTFLHVSHGERTDLSGVLMCINSTGIAYKWVKEQFGINSYQELNKTAGKSKTGANGLLFFPYGNGAERTLKNCNPGASILNLDLNKHKITDIFRAVQEGIVFSMHYGFEIMESMGLEHSNVRAGYSNMFLSTLFSQTFSNTTGLELQLYDTTGAEGAARGAALGAGIYKSTDDAFSTLKIKEIYEPNAVDRKILRDQYGQWLDHLRNKIIKE